jgi:hypothetical protein
VALRLMLVFSNLVFSNLGSGFDGDCRCGAHFGRLVQLVGQLGTGILHEDVEVAVAANLEHFRAHLHAGTGRRAHIEIDGYLHGVPLVVVVAISDIATFDQDFDWRKPSTSAADAVA